MGMCPTNTDGSLTPFVAKYCTALGYDMDMLRTMSAQELICAMSEKLNEVVCFDNETRDLVNEQISKVDAAVSEVPALVGQSVNEYTESSEFKEMVSQQVDQISAEQLTGMQSKIDQMQDTVDGINYAKAPAQKLANCCVAIGNSYLSGTGNSGRGFEHFIGGWFGEFHAFASDSAGFGTNSVASTTFSELVTQAANDRSFTNSDVDAVVFFSAIGDTYVLDAGTAATSYASTIQTVVNSARTSFPNATVYICFAEAVSTLTSRDSFSQNHIMYQYQLHNIYKAIENCVYLGWIGWNINLVPNLTDGAGGTTHPNDDGYAIIDTAFLRAWKGGNPYITRHANAAATDEYFEVDVNAATPEIIQVKLGQTKPANFPTSFTQGTGVVFGVFPATFFPPMGRPEFGMPVYNGDSAPLWFQMKFERSGSNMVVKGTPAATYSSTSLGAYLYFESEMLTPTFNQNMLY